jgi:hypothetical protein
VLVFVLVAVGVIVVVFVVGHSRASVEAQGYWARIQFASSGSRR